jgi:multidrug efflux pump subunit AcrA (membrane-fusion protein)
MSAAITRIDPVTDPASGTFRVTAAFRRRAGDPEPGADVRLVLPGGGAGSGLLLPARAVVEGDGDSTWVWRCDGDRVRRAPVRLGTVLDGSFRVEEGLADGATIVVESDRPLVEGARVAVEPGR